MRRPQMFPVMQIKGRENVRFYKELEIGKGPPQKKTEYINCFLLPIINKCIFPFYWPFLYDYIRLLSLTDTPFLYAHL